MSRLGVREDLDALKARTNDNKKQLDKLAEHVTRHQRLLTQIDSHAAIRLLDEMEARLTELSQRMRLFILKQTVDTEAARLYPPVAEAVIRAFDYDDVWWKDGDDCTIAQWRTRLLETHNVNGH